MERVEKGTGEVQVLLYPWASHYSSGGEILATESWASPQTCLPRKLNILRSQALLGCTVNSSAKHKDALSTGTCFGNFRNLCRHKWRRHGFHRLAETVVFKTAFHHRLRLQQVAAVEHQRPGHAPMDALPVELTELLPLGEDQQRVGVPGYFVGFAAALNLGKNCGSSIHRLPVVSAHLGAFR